MIEFIWSHVRFHIAYGTRHPSRQSPEKIPTAVACGRPHRVRAPLYPTRTD